MEIMVIDRSDRSVAKSEFQRHLKSCMTYSGQHEEPCFLVSVAVKPLKNDPDLTKAKSVRLSDSMETK